MMTLLLPLALAAAIVAIWLCSIDYQDQALAAATAASIARYRRQQVRTYQARIRSSEALVADYEARDYRVHAAAERCRLATMRDRLAKLEAQA